jgi:hypothetical protein
MVVKILGENPNIVFGKGKQKSPHFLFSQLDL